MKFSEKDQIKIAQVTERELKYLLSLKGVELVDLSYRQIRELEDLARERAEELFILEVDRRLDTKKEGA